MIGVVVVVVVLSKALQLLVFGVGPLGDEVAEFFQIDGSVPSELVVEVVVVQPVLEDVDDVVIREGDTGGLLLEETVVVLPESLISLLLATSEVITTAGALVSTLEVVNELLGESEPRVNGVWLQVL